MPSFLKKTLGLVYGTFKLAIFYMVADFLRDHKKAVMTHELFYDLLLNEWVLSRIAQIRAKSYFVMG